MTVSMAASRGALPVRSALNATATSSVIDADGEVEIEIPLARQGVINDAREPKVLVSVVVRLLGLGLESDHDGVVCGVALTARK